MKLAEVLGSAVTISDFAATIPGFRPIFSDLAATFSEIGATSATTSCAFFRPHSDYISCFMVILSSFKEFSPTSDKLFSLRGYFSSFRSDYKEDAMTLHEKLYSRLPLALLASTLSFEFDSVKTRQKCSCVSDLMTVPHFSFKWCENKRVPLIYS